MRIGVAVLLLLSFTGSAFAQSPTFDLYGFLSARGIYVKSPPSWTEGGFGRFDVGAESADDDRIVNVDVAQIGFDWTPRGWLLIHADGIARIEPSGTEGSRGGLLQAYVDVQNEQWRVRAGTFWLPTSRENVDPLWSSRYSITYSALNSWIGQEVRPIGVDLQYAPSFYVSLGGTAFWGNDAMGTALAGRGWTFGNRLSVYDEDLPLPLLESTTKPVGPDLDDRPGYAARVRVQAPERAMLQITHIDNRAPLVPELDGQEPWETRFDTVGGEVGSMGPTTVAAEWARGWTAVGFPGGTAKTDFETAYVLISHKRERERWTARVERFRTRDHERSEDDDNKEDGHALTLAWFHDVHESFRAGLEYVYVEGDRPGAVSDGFEPETGGSTVTFELRYEF